MRFDKINGLRNKDILRFNASGHGVPTTVIAACAPKKCVRGCEPTHTTKKPTAGMKRKKLTIKARKERC